MSARVLVIDDEEALRTSVAKIIGRLGHEVETASNGTQGLDRLSRAPFDVVLTDFKLPDLDGLEVLERARQIRPDAEIVLFTGFGSIPLAVQAIMPSYKIQFRVTTQGPEGPITEFRWINMGNDIPQTVGQLWDLVQTANDQMSYNYGQQSTADGFIQVFAT